jgi:UDP-2,4-diacetamido-2,4,6-trideoxy-beta-L-altropyranose hydrolase
MRIAIRVDSSAEMGTGHFMRCLTLADGLLSQGSTVRFVTRRLPPHLESQVTPRHEVVRLAESAATTRLAGGGPYSQWLGTTQETDAVDSARALAGYEADWLIVDHYAIDACWESALRNHVRRIAVIDDLADRKHDCDLLLDQNFYENAGDRYAGRIPESAKTLLGPRFALLRPEFMERRKGVNSRCGEVRRLLILFGGVDATNMTSRAISAVAGLSERGIRVDVVIGSAHAHTGQIAAACAAHGFELHVQTPRVADLMAAADLSIGAGGSTTWERCCLGLPTLAICTAENQRQQLRDAGAAGLVYALEVGADPELTIKRHLEALLENETLRTSLSRNGLRMVDGRGVDRILTAMGSSGITIRRASTRDSRQLFEWRNNPTIRVVSRNQDEIGWETHERWLAAVLSDDSRPLLVGERNGAPVGVVRFDIENEEAEISIYLVPGLNEPGLGGSLLRAAERWLADHHVAVRTVHAEVTGGNDRSRGMFVSAGYRIGSVSYSKPLNSE